MDAEKYVSDIVKRVKCTGSKKKEIRNQLLSDIAVRREQGEPLEQIMESMGSAQEIAEAFCQNLPDADRKAYRRKQIGMIVGAAMLVLMLFMVYIWWMLPKPAEFLMDYSQEEIAAGVENVIELLNQNDFGALQEISVDEMQTVLTRETIDKVRKNISDDWGGMKSIGTVYTQGMKQRGKLFIITQTDVIYENVSVVYTISFDKNLRLAGMYMR